MKGLVSIFVVIIGLLLLGVWIKSSGSSKQKGVQGKPVEAENVELSVLAQYEVRAAVSEAPAKVAVKDPQAAVAGLS